MTAEMIRQAMPKYLNNASRFNFIMDLVALMGFSCVAWYAIRTDILIIIMLSSMKIEEL